MRILNDLYSVLIAIWISPKNVHCNKYLLVDMGPVDVNRVIVNGLAPATRSPIRHVTQDPEWRSEISDSGAGELHEPLPPQPEPKMRNFVQKEYKTYKGKGYRQLKWGSQDAIATPPTDPRERPRHAHPNWPPPRVRMQPVIGEKNELCSDIGYPNIGSAKECSKVVSMLPFDASFDAPDLDSHPCPGCSPSPPGCFLIEVLSSISLVVWNPAKTGERDDMAKPICQNTNN